MADTRPVGFQWTIKVFPSEAWTDSDAEVVAAVSPVIAVAAGCVFASIAASVAGAAARSVAFSSHRPSVASVADVPAPVSAGVSAVLDPASGLASPAAAGISCPNSDCLCWEQWDVR